jgi:hypothetical protein
MNSGPRFIIRKHIYIVFILFSICCTILIRKYKNIQYYFSYFPPKHLKQSTPLFIFLLSYSIISSFTYFIITCILLTYTKSCA